MKILEFETIEDAESALDTINQMGADFWAARGYIADKENGVLPKNAHNGADDFSAPRVTSWDNIKESPEGTFYFISPIEDPEYANWESVYSQYGGVAYTEKEMPESWLPESEDI